MRVKRGKGLHTLHSDVILKILEYLKPDDVVRFQRLNKSISAVIDEHKQLARPPVSFKIDYLTDPAMASEVPELINNIRVTVRTVRGPFRVVTNCSLVALVDGCAEDRRFFSHVHEHLKELEVPSFSPQIFRIFLDWVFARMEPNILEMNIPLYDYMKRAFEGSMKKLGLSFKIQKLSLEHINQAEKEGCWYLWKNMDLTLPCQLELHGGTEYSIASFAGALRLNEYIKFYSEVTIRESANNIYAVMYCITKEWIRLHISQFKFRILFEEDKDPMTTNQLDFRNKFKNEHQFTLCNMNDSHFQKIHKIPVLIDQGRIDFLENRQRRVLRFTVEREKGCASVTMNTIRNGRIC